MWVGGSIFHLVLKKKWNKHTEYQKKVCPYIGTNSELRPCGACNKFYRNVNVKNDFNYYDNAWLLVTMATVS